VKLVLEYVTESRPKDVLMIDDIIYEATQRLINAVYSPSDRGLIIAKKWYNLFEIINI